MIPLFKNNPSLSSILPPLPFLWQKFELPFLKKFWIQKATDLTLSLRLPSYSVRIIGELIQILNNITITPYWMLKQLNPKIKISENMVHSFKKSSPFLSLISILILVKFFPHPKTSSATLTWAKGCFSLKIGFLICSNSFV